MSDKDVSKTQSDADASGSVKGTTGQPENHEKPDKGKGDLTIVGIGASAGGLDALQRMLPGLPANAGIAYVIVQHLAPKHRSMLSELLAKHTEMALETITDNLLVQPDTVYLTPPNKDVTLRGDRLRLSEAASIGPKPSIDYFFVSLAEEKKTHAVGIILSGSGTDGAHGIRAIKSHDGITMAQKAESAKFGSMPEAAIRTGRVDLVLPPEEIGQELTAALQYPHVIARVPLDTHKNEIDTIMEMLEEKTGVDFSDYKQTTIQRRISRRMVINRLENLEDYIAYIREDPDELTRLQKDMLISVTSFFRDPDAFDTLATHLEDLFGRRQPGDSFRAWVPGCATGEEAYSVAILVAEILGKDLNKYHVQILATDIDEDAVQLARRGEYPVATVMETDGRRFEKHFSYDDSTVKVKKHIRDMVVLAKQDLIKDTPFLHMDLISCRNLMIYLNPNLQEKLLSLFQFSLNPNGLLFLGKSESVNTRKDLFKTVDNKWKIYQRTDTPAKQLPKLMQNRYMAQLTTERKNKRKPQGNPRERVRQLFDSTLRLTESCVVLTDDNGNVLHIRGDARPYFEFPVGDMDESIKIGEVARPEIRFALQSMLHKSGKGGAPLPAGGSTWGRMRRGSRSSSDRFRKMNHRIGGPSF